MRKNIILFFRDKNENKIIATITQKQIEKINLDVNFHIFDLECNDIVSTIVDLKNKNENPDIVYIWEDETINQLSGFKNIKNYLINEFCEIIYLLYDSKYKEIILGDNIKSDISYKYTLIEKIKKDLNIINKNTTYYVINKKTLRVEQHMFENEYSIQNYLYFHDYCQIVKTPEEGRKILKIIGEERLCNAEQNYKELERKLNEILEIEENKLKKLKIQISRI